MKALTICQPYARLILVGEKAVENRTWYTRHRGPLLIHAGKSRAWLDESDDGHALVFGAIVGCATLAACVPINDIMAGKLDVDFPQLAGRAHCFGPWCWVLKDVVRYAQPIPWRGAQGLFDVPDAVLPGRMPALVQTEEQDG